MAEIHIIPRNDLIEHSDEECICGPETKFIDTGWTVVHHSLDGRELAE